MKNPPILVAVLGFFAALAGFGFIIMGFRLIGFDWFGLLGDLPSFEHVGLWGWLAVITGIVWLLVALGLWALQPWARLFAMIMAGVGLIEAAIAFFQFPGTGVGFAMAIMPGLILWYLTTSEVKEAFGLEAAPSQSTAPEAFASASPPVAAPVAAAVASAPAATAAVASPPAAPAAVVAAAAVVATEAAEPATAEPTTAEPASTPSEAAGAVAAYPHVPIVDVEGIGPAYADKLAAVGIVSTDQLLSAGASRLGRQKLAEASGISGHLILAWVNKVDLMRVPGVGPQYSDLLELAGVDSPAELAQRNAANLAQTVQEAVAARPGTVRRIATEAEIADWIEAAQSMPKVVEH
jgi:predicted flap endonuclease-1-like 5' DNA nuclease